VQHPTGAFDKSVIDALQKFERTSKFRRACLSAMAWSLTHEERKSVLDVFMDLDTSKRGSVSLWEFRNVLNERFGVLDLDVEDLFRSLDTSYEKQIHYSDFLAAMVSSRIAMHEHLLKGAFARLDHDGDGFITRENLQDLFGETFDVTAVEEFLAEVRQTGPCEASARQESYRISYEEFAAYIRSPVATEQLDAANRVIDVELAKQQENGKASVDDSEAVAKKRKLAHTSLTD